ncbi:MAG: hypothetical protein V8T10_10190 [Merdibacter sp.]
MARRRSARAACSRKKEAIRRASSLSELALYNDISVGDEITLQDQDGTAKLTLTVSGIYERKTR